MKIAPKKILLIIVLIVSDESYAQIWRCGLRAFLIPIKVAYLPVHSKYQLRTAPYQMKNSYEQEESRKHFSFLAGDKRDVLQRLCR
jgi:hypothetical protein